MTEATGVLEKPPVEKIPNTITKDVEAAIGLVEAGQAKAEGVKPVFAVWEDKYMDQIRPNYIVFHDEANATRFNELVEQTQRANLPDDGVARQLLWEERNKLADIDVETDSLKWLYRDGQWAMTPEELKRDVDSTLSQDAEDDINDREREHFKNRE